MTNYIENCGVCDSAKAEGKMPFVSHFNCLYGGDRSGHSKDGHCTADSCY